MSSTRIHQNQKLSLRSSTERSGFIPSLCAKNCATVVAPMPNKEKETRVGEFGKEGFLKRKLLGAKWEGNSFSLSPN